MAGRTNAGMSDPSKDMERRVRTCPLHERACAASLQGWPRVRALDQIPHPTGNGRAGCLRAWSDGWIAAATANPVDAVAHQPSSVGAEPHCQFAYRCPSQRPTQPRRRQLAIHERTSYVVGLGQGRACSTSLRSATALIRPTRARAPASPTAPVPAAFEQQPADQSTRETAGCARAHRLRSVAGSGPTVGCSTGWRGPPAP